MRTRAASLARRASGFCVCVCALAIGASAEELSLEKAIEIALEANAKLVAARAQSDSASQGERVARAAFLPTLGAQYGYTKADGDVFFGRFLTPQALGLPQAGAAQTGGTDIGTHDDTHQIGITLSETLFAGGARTAQVAASRIQGEIGREDVREQEIALAFDVKKLYLDAVLADKAKSVAAAAVERSEENQKAVRTRLAEKEALKVEKLGADSRLASDRQRLLEAESSRRLAGLALNQTLGRELDRALELSADALEKEPEAPGESEAVREALGASPAVARAKLQMELAEQSLRKAQAAFYPKLGATARMGYLSSQYIFEGFLYGADVNISIPFLQDLAAGRAEVDQARAQQRSAEAALREVTTALELQVRAALVRFDERRQGIAVAKQSLDYQREKYEVTRAGYAEQVFTFSDLLDEQVLFSNSDLTQYRALYALQTAKADLDRLLGKR